MLVKNLKVLHMEKPLAIDVVPYFSWMMESDIPNTMQEVLSAHNKGYCGELHI